MAPDPAALDPALAVEQVLATVRGTSIAELEIEWEGGSLRLRRSPRGTAALELNGDADRGPADEIVVTSAHVGVFHHGTGKTARGVGDMVEVQAVLGEIETLGVRYTVSTPARGEITDILVEDKSPVEYGQRLIVLRAADTAP